MWRNVHVPAHVFYATQNIDVNIDTKDNKKKNYGIIHSSYTPFPASTLMELY